MHESTMHTANSFITLTFDEEHLPKDGSLDVKHWQDFAKRLRKKMGSYRYYHCGEYGDRYGRPHYHACLFGIDFTEDRQLVDPNNGQPLYESQLLTNTWGKGTQCIIGNLTFDSAAYVSGYILKKINGKKKKTVNPKTGLTHYERCNPETGEIVELTPEYSTMSRGGTGGKGGIGKGWIDKWMNDVYPRDFVIANGHKSGVPKYYDTQYELIHPEKLTELKEARVENAKQFEKDRTPQRLRQREMVAKGKIALYKRNN